MPAVASADGTIVIMLLLKLPCVAALNTSMALYTTDTLSPKTATVSVGKKMVVPLNVPSSSDVSKSSEPSLSLTTLITLVTSVDTTTASLPLIRVTVVLSVLKTLTLITAVIGWATVAVKTDPAATRVACSLRTAFENPQSTLSCTALGLLFVVLSSKSNDGSKSNTQE